MSAYLLLTNRQFDLDRFEPVHFYLSLGLALTLSAVIVAADRIQGWILGWKVIVYGCVLVVFLELIQIMSDSRSVQLQDVIDGMAGVTSAAIVVSLLSRHFEWKWIATTLALLSFVALLLVFYTVFTSHVPKTDCDLASQFKTNWHAELFRNFRIDDRSGAVVAGNGLVFCPFEGRAEVKNNKLLLSRSGLSSNSLEGLHEAVKEQGRFTFGVRFQPASAMADWPPATIARLDYENLPPSRYLARMLQFEKSVSASLQFKRNERSDSSVLNKNSENFHELVVDYDGKATMTWFDAELIAIEYNTLSLPADANNKLNLTLGWRKDMKRRSFDGVVDSIYIGTKAISESDIESIFSPFSP